MSDFEWLEVFLFINHKQDGPYKYDELKTMLDKNKITRGTLIWYEGLPSWITLGDLPAFDRRKTPRTSQPQASVADDQFLAVIESKVTEIKKQDFPSFMLNKKIRRADMVYDVVMKRWTRADQHPETHKYFDRPLIPSQVLQPVSVAPKPQWLAYVILAAVIVVLGVVIFRQIV